MEKKEQEALLHKLKEQMDTVEVSESVKPEKIEKLLQEQGKRQKSFLARAAKAGMGIAAVILIGTAGILLMNSRNEGHRDEKSTCLVSEDQIKAADETLISSANDYGQLYDLIEENNEVVIDEAAVSDTLASQEQVAAYSESDTAGNSAKEYSRTNEQVEGVSEGDIVKTDGNYIYSLQQSKSELFIVKAVDGEMEQTASFKLDDNSTASEMYLHDDKLVLILESGGGMTVFGASCGVYGEKEDASYCLPSKSITKIVTLDVSDKENIRKLGEITLDGNYSSSRISEGYLYIFSYFIPSQEIDKNNKESYIPSVNGEFVEPQDIYLPRIEETQGYLVVASVNLEHPEAVQDSKAVMMYGQLFYVSSNNIYVVEPRWENIADNTDNGIVSSSAINKTWITKIAYSTGSITPVTAGELEGNINDRFSLDEYQGYLRVVATKTDQQTGDTSNSLYILDESLQVTGKVEGLARGESIYSARFMGDTGYFVTYRQVDPLFSVDLTDVTNPVVLGELKVSGFSEYLHFYGENQLLGMGWETGSGSIREGLKLSLFDISDPAEVVEKDKKVLTDVTDCPGLYNPKAVCIDSSKNIIGFQAFTSLPASEAGYQQYNNMESYYYTYSYQPETGFVKTSETKVSDYYWVRGLFIKDVLYIVDNGVVKAVSLSNGNELGSVILN